MWGLAEPKAGADAGGSLGAQKTQNGAVVVQSRFSRELQGAGMEPRMEEPRLALTAQGPGTQHCWELKESEKWL